MKKLLVKRSDGGISIIIPSKEATLETMERDARLVSGYISHELIEEDSIPKDRTFRNAWRHDLSVDLSKAQEQIRDKRNESLNKLDAKALSESRKPNGNVSAINNEAQRLRDIPQHPDFNSSDVNKLKALLLESNLKI